MQKILDRLLLCELSEANDPLYLKRHQIQAILYFGSGGMFGEDIKLYHQHTLPDGTLSREMLEDGINFLRESLRAGRRVLAVGSSGATIVAAYLAEMGMSNDQAMQMINKEKTPAPLTDALEAHRSELERRSSLTLNHGR